MNRIRGNALAAAAAVSALVVGATLILLEHATPASAASSRQARPAPRVLRARAGALVGHFEAAGARFVEGERSFALRSTRFGRRGAMNVLEAPPPSGDGAEVRYAHGAGVVEWWRPSTFGLEHGYDVAARIDGDGPLVAEIEVSGLEAVAVPGGVELRGASTSRILYTHLRAEDARGRALLATMEVARGAIRLVVDDAGAQYPIAIDPLLTTSAVLAPAMHETVSVAHFGTAVGVSDSVIVVGAPEVDAPSPNSGRAFVFNAGSTDAHILPRTAPRTDDSFFGLSVAVDGERFVVGAPYENLEDAGLSEEGAAYVYERTGATSWAETRITASTEAELGDYFGQSLAIRGDLLAAGAPGRTTRTGIVYLVLRDAAGWPAAPTASVSAPDAATNRGFGFSVALSDDTLVVGASQSANTLEESVYIYARGAGASATYEETLHAMDGVVGDRFGWAVSISGDLLAVGAPGYGPGAFNASPGAVYVFERQSGAWSQVQRLAVSGTLRFGWSVALSGDLLLIGAPATSSYQGAAHLFYRDPAGQWEMFPNTLGAPSSSDNFGAAVALHGGLGVVGALGATTYGPTFSADGEAVSFRFELEAGTPCRAVSAPICEQGACVDGFCCASACSGGCNACSAAAGSPADGQCGVRALDVVCRPVADSCDVAEVCDGVAATCPDDVRIEECTVLADAGGDGGATTFPAKQLSCFCEAAGVPATGPLFPALGAAFVALLVARRRRRRAAR